MARALGAVLLLVGSIVAPLKLLSALFLAGGSRAQANQAPDEFLWAAGAGVGALIGLWLVVSPTSSPPAEKPTDHEHR
ncbi:MAG: hypothetical protein SFW67_07605 [Myxococcaceae bacterium]|nr:hypothetical protein [Myxococcaceae bacterium]